MTTLEIIIFSLVILIVCILFIWKVTLYTKRRHYYMFLVYSEHEIDDKCIYVHSSHKFTTEEIEIEKQNIINKLDCKIESIGVVYMGTRSL